MEKEPETLLCIPLSGKFVNNFSAGMGHSTFWSMEDVSLLFMIFLGYFPEVTAENSTVDSFIASDLVSLVSNRSKLLCCDSGIHFYCLWFFVDCIERSKTCIRLRA